ncbi:MAG: hypothetical protein AMJ53_00860 [Gammaproteobacteria bacterium SG8_11]|nr:MAG: hypothetical protein AMJ53_00860 [Gammaproteobacteria bacterium SG8_11]
MPNPMRKKPVLAWEISITLVLKVILIYAIWLWFFSNPVDEHLDDNQVQNAIFGSHIPVIQQSATAKNPVEDQ